MKKKDTPTTQQILRVLGALLGTGDKEKIHHLLQHRTKSCSPFHKLTQNPSDSGDQIRLLELFKNNEFLSLPGVVKISILYVVSEFFNTAK